MQPIAFGDSRPGAAYSTNNKERATLRDQWLTAIANDVDWVQYRTWSDFSERCANDSILVITVTATSM